jgi:hypothetical protein
MTLFELLCALRQRLLKAIDDQDRNTFEAMYTTFDVLLEASYESNDKVFIALLEDFCYSAQHAGLADFKARDALPSIERIQSVLADNSN